MKEYKQRSIKEARAEEMLEVPLEWNEVPDLMMEEEDVLPETTESPEGGENDGRKTISSWRNEDTRPQYHRGYKIQRDSIPKIGTKTNKRKMSGKHQTSFRRSHRWCFATEN